MIGERISYSVAPGEAERLFEVAAAETALCRDWGRPGDAMLAVRCDEAGLLSACLYVTSEARSLHGGQLELESPFVMAEVEYADDAARQRSLEVLAAAVVDFANAELGRVATGGGASRLLLDGPVVEEFPELVNSCQEIVDARSVSEEAFCLRDTVVRLPGAGRKAAQLGHAVLGTFAAD